jgi:hypothetical protein
VCEARGRCGAVEVLTVTALSIAAGVGAGPGANLPTSWTAARSSGIGSGDPESTPGLTGVGARYTGLPGVPGGLLGPAVFAEANVSCDGGDIALQDSFATFYIGDESSFPHVSLQWELHGTKVVARLTDPRISGLSCHTADGGVFGSGGQLDGSFDDVSPFSLQ